MVQFLYPQGGTPPKPLPAASTNRGVECDQVAIALDTSGVALAGQIGFSGFEPLGFVAQKFPEGFRGAQYDIVFAKPFPVAEQQFFPSFEPRPPIGVAFLEGWRGPQYETKFAQAVAASEQQNLAAFEPQGAITEKMPEGWRGYQLSHQFTAPLASTEQQFSPGAFPPITTAANTSTTFGSFGGEQLVLDFTGIAAGSQFSSLSSPPFLAPPTEFNAFFTLLARKYRPIDDNITTLTTLHTISNNVAGWPSQFNFNYVFTPTYPAGNQQFGSWQPLGNIAFISNTKVPPGADSVNIVLDFSGIATLTYSTIFGTSGVLAEAEGFFDAMVNQPSVIEDTGWMNNKPLQITANTPVGSGGYFGYQLDYRFAPAFPVSAQQFNPFTPLGKVGLSFLEGWRGFNWDYRVFAKPFPVELQHFADETITPATTLASIFLEGWRGYQFDFAIKKPFPVEQQRYIDFERVVFTTPTPQGWFPPSPDLFKALFVEKPYLAFSNSPLIVVANTAPGSVSFQSPEIFVKPFLPAWTDFFNAWVALAFGPPGGSGDRVPPIVGPWPPYGVKPNEPIPARKSIKPVWDRGRIEEPKPSAPAKPAGPPPLPPLSIFGAKAPVAVVSPQGLPTFNEYVPQNTMGLQQHLKDLQDQADAMAVLKRLGLIKE